MQIISWIVEQREYSYLTILPYPLKKKTTHEWIVNATNSIEARKMWRAINVWINDRKSKKKKM